MLSGGTAWRLPSLGGLEFGPQHISILGNTSESSYSGCVCYYEAGDLQILWSRDLRENLGILSSNEEEVHWLLQKSSLVLTAGGRGPGE